MNACEWRRPWSAAARIHRLSRGGYSGSARSAVAVTGSGSRGVEGAAAYKGQPPAGWIKVAPGRIRPASAAGYVERERDRGGGVCGAGVGAGAGAGSEAASRIRGPRPPPPRSKSAMGHYESSLGASTSAGCSGGGGGRRGGAGSRGGSLLARLETAARKARLRREQLEERALSRVPTHVVSSSPPLPRLIKKPAGVGAVGVGVETPSPLLTRRAVSLSPAALDMAAASSSSSSSSSSPPGGGQASFHLPSPAAAPASPYTNFRLHLAERRGAARSSLIAARVTMHDALLAEAEAAAVAASAKCRAAATTTTILDNPEVYDDRDPLLVVAEAEEAAAAEAQEARRRVAALVIQKSAMSHMAKQEMKRHARSQTLAQKCDRARVVLGDMKNSLREMRRLALGSPARVGGGAGLKTTVTTTTVTGNRAAGGRGHDKLESAGDSENAFTLPCVSSPPPRPPSFLATLRI